MKITWVQDYQPFRFSGGAGLTDRTHIEEGYRRGHTFKYVIAEENELAVDTDTDLVLVSNATAFGEGFFHELKKQGLRYVMFLHDYTQLCRWRLFFPMADKCKQCYLRERWLPVLEQAASFVWLSPLHRDAYLHVYPELAGRAHALVPSPVRPADFFPMGLKREGVVAINSLQPFKGRQNFLDWCAARPHIPVSVIGAAPEDGLPANVKCLGNLRPVQMNEALNHFEAFIHLPANPMPFERSVAEAYLAGCDLIVNENVGATSWSWFTDRPSVAAHLEQAPRHFWEHLEGLAQ